MSDLYSWRADGKALLCFSKALTHAHSDIETKAMLTTAERMAAKLAEALSNPPLKHTAVAEACGVTKQAVQGWLRTGRFDKRHLPTLASLTGRPLEWWLEADTNTSAGSVNLTARQAIAHLSVLGAKLTDQSWRHLIVYADFLLTRQKLDPEDLPLEADPSHQSILEARVKEAEQRRDQKQHSHHPSKKRAA